MGLFKIWKDHVTQYSKSSTAEYASVQKNVTSACKVTGVNTKGTHPYHCISQDGKGVYGWVDAADVK